MLSPYRSTLEAPGFDKRLSQPLPRDGVCLEGNSAMTLASSDRQA